MKRALLIVVVLLIGVVLVRVWLQHDADSTTLSSTRSTGSNPPAGLAVGRSAGSSETSPPVDGPILIAKDLNRADGTIAKDLRIVEDLLDAWRTNFPHDGNPWGENSEIAAGLSGRNSLHLVLIPRTHIAFNSAGELCDRWGTPFRFHALSGSQMEVRSAGPDKTFGTPDDATLSP